MPREYSLLAEDILKYNPRIIMAGGGGVDLSAKEGNLLGKSTSYPEKEKEKRDTEEMVGEMIESIAKGGDYSNAGYESANWAGQYSDMDVAQRGAVGADPSWGASYMESQLNPSTSYDASTGGTYNPYRQQGGPVQEGQPYVVGEQGPETFVPNQSGTIVPNDKSFSQGIQEFWNELFGGQGTAQDDFIKQPPLMPRDSNIGGITPIPTPPNPYEGTFDAFQADSPRRPQNPWSR